MRSAILPLTVGLTAFAGVASADCAISFVANGENGGTVTMPTYTDNASCSLAKKVNCPTSGSCGVKFQFTAFNTESYDKLVISIGGVAIPGAPFSGNLGAFTTLYMGASTGDDLTFSFTSDGSNNNYPGFSLRYETYTVSTTLATSKTLLDNFYAAGDKKVQVALGQVQWVHRERQCSTMTGCGAWKPVTQTFPCGVSTASNANYALNLDLNDVTASAPGRWNSQAAISRTLTAKCGCSQPTTLYDFGTSSKLSPADYSIVKSCKIGSYSNIPTYTGVKDVTNANLDVSLYGDRVEITGSGTYKIEDQSKNTLTFEVESKFTGVFNAITVVETRGVRKTGYTPSAVWTDCAEPAATARDVIGQWFVPGSAEVSVPIVDSVGTNNYGLRTRRCSNTFGCDDWTETNTQASGKGFGSSSFQLMLTAYDNVLSANMQVMCSSTTGANMIDVGPVPMSNAGMRPAGVPTPMLSTCKPADYNTVLGSLITSSYFNTAGTSQTPIPSSGTVANPGTYTTKLTKHCVQVTSSTFRVTPASNDFADEYYESQIAWLGTMVDDSQKIIRAATNTGIADGANDAAAAAPPSWPVAVIATVAAATVAIAAVGIVIRRRAASAASVDNNAQNAEQLLESQA